MAYTALYRKLRPSTFEDIIGQDHIVKTLKNQIENNRISHAYLFCGTRGTGKTSTAKVFAKAINCTNPINMEPCNKCESCTSELTGQNMDIIEIDAASNNGVDNIRDIREEANYTPTVSQYKVYIIDEVHMLSTGAFNALLKTLEEPPAHVIFILATTDPQKLPATILSRCQRFDFRRITATTMAATLRMYMENESEQITDDALNYICYLSDGAMRDALSILDQAMAFYFNEEITMEKILELMGSVDKSVFFKFANALVNYNSEECLQIINELLISGRDINQFLDEFIGHLRDLLVCKSSPNILNYSNEYIEKLSEQSKNIELNIIIDYISMFSELQNSIKYTKNKKILLEATCIRVCNIDTEDSLSGIMAKIDKLEKNMNTKPIIQQVVQSTPIEKKPEVKYDKAMSDDVKLVYDNWQEIIDYAFNKDSSYFLLKSLNMGNIKEDTIDILYHAVNSNEENSPSSKEVFNNHVEYIKSILREMYNKDFNVQIKTETNYQAEHKKEYGTEDDKLALSNYHLEQLRNQGIEIIKSDE